MLFFSFQKFIELIVCCQICKIKSLMSSSIKLMHEWHPLLFISLKTHNFEVSILEKSAFEYWVKKKPPAQTCSPMNWTTVDWSNKPNSFLCKCYRDANVFVWSWKDIILIIINNDCDWMVNSVNQNGRHQKIIFQFT